MKPITKISIGMLILFKIALGSIFVYRIAPENFFLGNNAIAAETVQDVNATPPIENVAFVKEEINIELLIRQRNDLKAREEILDKKREELVAIQEDVREKIKILGRLRSEINAQKATEKSLGDKKIKHLLKVYSAMKPQRAAGLLEKMDIDFSVSLLSQMKGDVAGSILTHVDLEKAARISEGLAKN